MNAGTARADVDRAGIPAPRGGLRAVPAAGPSVQLKLGNPLQLTKTMRGRLLGAVRALVMSPELAGASDGARLAAVVLTAKSSARDDYRASTWTADLGRWMGVSQSTVAHTVLPELRAAGLLSSHVTTNALGYPTGLDCQVIPMYQAQKAGDRRHALALSRSELAVLFSLITVLFGPGWTRKDREPVPAGLLAGRTGRGAATDRLGLLLMVLTTGSKGWLRLCPGSVDTRRGRPAATVARLLGCTAAAGAKVLSRLQEHGVANVVRQESGSGLHARSRVRLVPVARAHGVAVREARRTATAVFSDLADAASGDHGAVERGESLVATGVEEAVPGESAGSADLAAAAQPHALHASVGTSAGELTLSGGFSGEGRQGFGDLPDRACVREDGGPLRGEQPEESLVDEQMQNPLRAGAGAGAGDRPAPVGGGKAQRRPGIRPVDVRLRVALDPVAGLWGRLSGWQQDEVEVAATRELARLEGLLDQPGGAPRLLAERLVDRLEESGGEALVDSPFPWLTRRGLVQRTSCSDLRCDDGIRLDTGGECGTCGNVFHIRRGRRARIGAEIDRELPGLSRGERRRVVEERLREQAAIEAEVFVWRREQARADEARQARARAAGQARAERERVAAAVADAARQALPCEDCGQERAAGQCEACGYRRRTAAAIVEAGMVAATWSGDLGNQGDVEAVSAGVRASIEREIAAARGDYLRAMVPGDQDGDPVGAAAALAFGGLHIAEQALAECRREALAMLGRTEEAEAEARQVYRIEQSRRWFKHNRDGVDAVAAATKAANAARERTAEHLLAVRLVQLRDQAAVQVEDAAPTLWTERLTQLAARPLDDDVTGAVIV